MTEIQELRLIKLEEVRLRPHGPKRNSVSQQMDRQVIRDRMAQIGVTQEQIAQAMGIERTLFSRILRGRRPMPKGMEARIHAVLDQLKEKLLAERAEAAEAVEKLRRKETK